MRLIDANALLEKIQYRLPYEDGVAKLMNDVVEITRRQIGNAPTVDAVEVVRCKDCKHSVWDEDEGLWKCVYDADFDEQYGDYFGFAEYNDGLHFCSYGERRDGE